jgi:succinyl-CoA synthetase beta subunit
MRKGMMKFFDLHEYESKVLFKKNGARVEKCALVKTTEEAVEQAKRLSGKVVLKCQVHAGGRGKGHLTSGLQGGVQMCNDLDDVRKYSKLMLGHNLITIQTPKEGLPVNSLLVSEVIDVKKQFYLAFLLDRKYGGPVILASNEGGVNIEEVAKKNPNAIIVQPVDVKVGITSENIQNVVNKLDFNQDQKLQAADQLKKVYEMFIKYDATQIEINPWAVDSDGKVF